MKKSINKQQSSLFDKFKAFYQSRYGKMTLFFGFYFFFFLFLISNININNKTNQNNSDTNINENNGNNSNVSEPTTWKFDILLNDYYTYNYYINENGNNISFNGRLNETNQIVEEYQYNYFLNLYNINQIIKKSKYLERIELDNGYQYNYEVSNKSLGELLEIDGNFSNLFNKIVIYTNNNLIVSKIDLDLGSYMQELNNYNEYKITLQYEKVKE